MLDLGGSGGVTRFVRGVGCVCEGVDPLQVSEAGRTMQAAPHGAGTEGRRQMAPGG